MITEHKVALNGLEFDYLAAGKTDGKPVILLHGFPQFADLWEPLLDRLETAAFRGVALQQRGYSRSARPTGVEEYAVSKLTSDVLALADHLTWSQFHLVGHDWGAFIAWVLAAEHPDRILSLAALSTPHVDAFLEAVVSDPDQKTRSQYIHLFKMPGNAAESIFLQNDGVRLRAVFEGKVSELQIEKNLKRILEPGALTAALNWYRALDLNARIGPVRVSTLYLWGDRDIALGHSAAESAEQYVIGPYRFEVLPGFSHWLLDEAPARMCDLIVEHLTHSDPHRT